MPYSRLRWPGYVTGTSFGPPRPLSGGQSTYSSSLFGVVAILLALRARRPREREDTSICRRRRQWPPPRPRDDGLFPRWDNLHRQGRVYGDGSFAIFPARRSHSLSLSTNWETLLELMAAEGKAEELVGEEWRDKAYRATHRDRIRTAVGRWAESHTKAELFALGQAMRFPWAPGCTLEEVLESPQLAARQFFVRTSTLSGGERPAPLPGPPYRFRSFSPPPRQKLSLNPENITGKSLRNSMWSARKEKKIAVEPSAKSLATAKNLFSRA